MVSEFCFLDRAFVMYMCPRRVATRTHT